MDGRFDGGELIACPACGKRDDIDGVDVLGADGNNVFCTDCHCEFDPDTGVVAPLVVGADSED